MDLREWRRVCDETECAECKSENKASSNRTERQEACALSLSCEWAHDLRKHSEILRLHKRVHKGRTEEEFKQLCHCLLNKEFPNTSRYRIPKLHIKAQETHHISPKPSGVLNLHSCDLRVRLNLQLEGGLRLSKSAWKDFDSNSLPLSSKHIRKL